MDNFKAVYNISLYDGKRTPFHKKYRVYDGLGGVYFDTLQECRSYVLLKSTLLKKLYQSSKSFYKKISEHYFDKVIKFRVTDSVGNKVNDLLSDILGCYRYLTKQYFFQYALSKLRHIYTQYLEIAKLLNMTLLYKSIKSLYDSFFTPYPEYRSTDYVKKDSLSVNRRKAI
ncbi:MAG: hypothetical protein LBN74_04385 [Prevotella sp.]|jgi:hypothetical protein|nr:hypothetical protein [Prevotella sp.]